jgi:hypothetical protein
MHSVKWLTLQYKKIICRKLCAFPLKRAHNCFFFIYLYIHFIQQFAFVIFFTALINIEIIFRFLKVIV